MERAVMYAFEMRNAAFRKAGLMQTLTVRGTAVPVDTEATKSPSFVQSTD